MGMTVISVLLKAECSANVFVYVGQLICDSVRGRPTGRLKSLVMPEIIIMSLQLSALRNNRCGAGQTLNNQPMVREFVWRSVFFFIHVFLH